MGAFLSAIGGAGNAAGHYGEQVRGLLESRRKDFADLIGKVAEQESDPQTRASLLLHSADLHAGKPIGKITGDFLKTMERRQKDHEALTQAIGAPPGAPPPPAPSTAPPGQVPGTVGVPNGAGQGAPAAQPATNPIQGPLVPGMIGVRPEMLTPQPEAPAPVLTPSPTSQMVIDHQSQPLPVQDSQAIMNRVMADPRWSAPANRPMLTAEATTEIQHGAALRQEQALRQMDLTERQTALKELEASPEWNSLSPITRSQYRLWAHSRTAPVPALSAGMMRPQTSRVDAQTMSPEDKAAHGIPADATGPYWTYTDIMSGQPARTAQPAGVGTVQSVDQGGNVSRVENRPGANLGVLPGIASAQNRPREETNVQGGKFLFTPGQEPKAIPGAVNPSFIPSQSTNVTQIPGQLPEVRTTTRTKGGGPSLTPAPKPTGAGLPTVGGDAATRQAYDQWAAGGAAPTGKKLTAVQQYMDQNKLPLPTTLSAAGQSNLQAVDAVFREIDDAMRLLDKIKGNPSIAVDYMRYKHLGQSTPYDELFTKLSFEGLRSAAAALKGNNSRAYPVIQRAFEHVPNLDRWHGLNPDAISLMKDKLKAMRTVLDDTKASVLEDQKKSGVVSLTPAPSAPVADPLGIR